MKQQQRLLGSMIIFIGLLIFNFSAFADIVIKNGSTMKVSTGTIVVVSSDVTVEAGGIVDNSGTVTVKGNFSNSGAADLGTGEVIFSGTVAQTISGSTVSEFEDLTINNAAGVTLGVAAVVDGTMTFTSGLVSIGANNLTFGATAAVGGTPSASAMIVATSTGEVRKAYTDGTGVAYGAFTFPIGDNTGTAEYSPVTMTFNASDFASAYASARVTPSAHAEIATAPDYLSRYWTLGQNGITNMDCDLSFSFLDADVTGTKANLWTLQYVAPGWVNYNQYAAGNVLTADNVSSFSEWSGASRISVGMEGVLFVDGPYNTSTNLMSTSLNAYLPLDQPFDAIPSAQWYYAGTESVGSIPNANIVDWVLIELRQAATPATALVGNRIGMGVGFLLNDGNIVGLDGTSAMKIDGVNPITTNVYAIAFQRNHLGVMSAIAVTDSDADGSYDYDFSSGTGQVYGGANAVRELETGVYGLIAGDGSGDGVVSTTDYSAYWAQQYGSSGGYFSGDFNMDGIVSIVDYSAMWAQAFGSSLQYP